MKVDQVQESAQYLVCAVIANPSTLQGLIYSYLPLPPLYSIHSALFSPCVISPPPAGIRCLLTCRIGHLLLAIAACQCSLA